MLSTTRRPALATLAALSGRAVRREQPWAELAELPYFAGLPRPMLQAASQHADRFTVRTGTRLDRQGWRARFVWLPLDAPFELRIDGHQCGEIPTGGVASETTVLQSLPSPYDVVTATDTSVVSLPSRAFHGLLADAWFAEQVTARARGEVRTAVIDVRAPARSVALATSRL